MKNNNFLFVDLKTQFQRHKCSSLSLSYVYFVVNFFLYYDTRTQEHLVEM